MNNDPEILRCAAMKCTLKFAMQALNCHDYEELRSTCFDIIDMLDYVESKRNNHG